jgi:hypothetical protein
MTASEDLIDWNDRWKITNGIVYCRSCQAQQKEIDRGEAFVHSSDFGYSGQRCSPWDDLDAIRNKYGRTN